MVSGNVRMNHVYKQSTGEWFHEGELLGTGYAGRDNGKNNPSMQGVHNIGPIPEGWYTIGEVITNGGHLGPYVFPLTPDDSNEMFGRGGFFLHGDSISNPGSASNGCIIQNRLVRTHIFQTGDKRLQVIA